jgi:hypothetical protein
MRLLMITKFLNLSRGYKIIRNPFLVTNPIHTNDIRYDPPAGDLGRPGTGSPMIRDASDQPVPKIGHGSMFEAVGIRSVPVVPVGSRLVGSGALEYPAHPLTTCRITLAATGWI